RVARIFRPRFERRIHRSDAADGRASPCRRLLKPAPASYRGRDPGHLRAGFAEKALRREAPRIATSCYALATSPKMGAYDPAAPEIPRPSALLQGSRELRFGVRLRIAIDVLTNGLECDLPLVKRLPTSRMRLDNVRARDDGSTYVEAGGS